jgi:hypothetical protein
LLHHSWLSYTSHWFIQSRYFSHLSIPAKQPF